MAETTPDESKSSRKRSAVIGTIVDVKLRSEVIDPRGVTRVMGGDKYVLDQVGEHVVDGQVYDVTDPEGVAGVPLR